MSLTEGSSPEDIHELEMRIGEEQYPSATPAYVALQQLGISEDCIELAGLDGIEIGSGVSDLTPYLLAHGVGSMVALDPFYRFSQDELLDYADQATIRVLDAMPWTLQSQMAPIIYMTKKTFFACYDQFGTQVFREGYLTRTGVADASVDFVLALNSFSLALPEDNLSDGRVLEAALREMFRIVRRGGRIYLFPIVFPDELTSAESNSPIATIASVHQRVFGEVVEQGFGMLTRKQIIANSVTVMDPKTLVILTKL